MFCLQYLKTQFLPNKCRTSHQSLHFEIVFQCWVYQMQYCNKYVTFYVIFSAYGVINKYPIVNQICLCLVFIIISIISKKEVIWDDDNSRNVIIKYVNKKNRQMVSLWNIWSIWNWADFKFVYVKKEMNVIKKLENKRIRTTVDFKLNLFNRIKSNHYIYVYIYTYIVKLLLKNHDLVVWNLYIIILNKLFHNTFYMKIMPGWYLVISIFFFTDNLYSNLIFYNEVLHILRICSKWQNTPSNNREDRD